MKKIGKYTVRGILGRGGMGVVYKAEMPWTGKIVALKACEPREVLEEILGMEEIRRRFLREAATMAGIRHPNVAGVWDVGEDEGRPYFTTEYYCNNLGGMIGESFDLEAPTRPIPVGAALGHVRGVLHALGRLHHTGVIHMDVKPHNMMLTDEDTIKLIDFGLSRRREERLPGPSSVKAATPFYTAPEQEEDPDAADERSDLFSAGVTLFRLVTGRLPEGGRRASETLPDPDGLWDRFFGRALAREPGGRYASAADMLRTVEDLVASWSRDRERACVYPDLPEGARKGSRRSVRLRDAPVKVLARKGREVFGADVLWRPRVPVVNDLLKTGGGTVLDRATGLRWEPGGSPYPVTWPEAARYVAALNRQAYGGFEDWRLPTVDELFSLFKETFRPGEFCFDEVFEDDRPRIWSADRRSFTSAWYVDAEIGFAGWQDLTCFFYARAVRSESPERSS